MNSEMLEAIASRTAAARPGPWTAEFGDYEGAWLFEATVWLPDGSMGVAVDGSEADAEFIAHARTDIPELLGEVDRLNRVIASLQDRTVA